MTIFELGMCFFLLICFSDVFFWLRYVFFWSKILSIFLQVIGSNLDEMLMVRTIFKHLEKCDIELCKKLISILFNRESLVEMIKQGKN